MNSKIASESSTRVFQRSGEEFDLHGQPLVASGQLLQSRAEWMST
jgi:hypothetical protein